MKYICILIEHFRIFRPSASSLRKFYSFSPWCRRQCLPSFTIIWLASLRVYWLLEVRWWLHFGWSNCSKICTHLVRATPWDHRGIWWTLARYIIAKWILSLSLILPWTILWIISVSKYAVVLSPCFSRLDWLNRCTELCELQSSSQYHPQQHIQHNRFLECANRHRRLLSSRRSVPHYYDYWLIGLVVSRQGRVFAFYTRRTYSHILGEIAHYTAEAAYASLTRHAPPGGLHNVSNRTQVGKQDSNKLHSRHSRVHHAIRHTLGTWYKRTYNQRVASFKYAIAATEDQSLWRSIFRATRFCETYILPSNVQYSDTLIKGYTFQCANKCHNFWGRIAYNVDSSDEDRTGFIMFDLATGELITSEHV